MSDSKKLIKNLNQRKYMAERRGVIVARTCIKCGKIFIHTGSQQYYCYDPCKPETPLSNKRLEKYINYKEKYYSIASIRKMFSRLMVDNPVKARQLRNEMIDEEGLEFSQLAIGDIYEKCMNNPEFIERKKIVEKFNLKKAM